MSEEATTKMARTAERFVAKSKTGKSTYVKGHWKPIEFPQLKQGDIFRLWDGTGHNRKPDYIIDDKHDVCVAIGDAYECKDSHGIESMSVRGF